MFNKLLQHHGHEEEPVEIKRRGSEVKSITASDIAKKYQIQIQQGEIPYHKKLQKLCDGDGAFLYYKKQATSLLIKKDSCDNTPQKSPEKKISKKKKSLAEERHDQHNTAYSGTNQGLRDSQSMSPIIKGSRSVSKQGLRANITISGVSSVHQSQESKNNKFRLSQQEQTIPKDETINIQDRSNHTQKLLDLSRRQSAGGNWGTNQMLSQTLRIPSSRAQSRNYSRGIINSTASRFNSVSPYKEQTYKRVAPQVGVTSLRPNYRNLSKYLSRTISSNRTTRRFTTQTNTEEKSNQKKPVVLEQIKLTDSLRMKPQVNFKQIARTGGQACPFSGKDQKMSDDLNIFLKQKKNKAEQIRRMCDVAEVNNGTEESKFNFDLQALGVKQDEFHTTLKVLRELEFADSNIMELLYTYKIKDLQEEQELANEVAKEYKANIMDPAKAQAAKFERKLLRRGNRKS